MPSLRARQILTSLAKSTQKEEKISKREIEKKINRIKYLASQKKVSKTTIKKELARLEEKLQGIFSLEKELQEKKKKENQEIARLKKQTKELRQKMAKSEEPALRKKVEKLSHMLGDLMAKEAIKKEVKFEENKSRLQKKVPEEISTDLKKIDQLQERILALKKSGQYPPEKIALLEERLNQLEKKLISAPPSKKEPQIKHRMLFGPQAEKPLPPPPKKSSDKGIEKEMEELPLPPPPRIIKKK